MNISFGEPQPARTGCVSFAVRGDDDAIGTTTNALTPNRTFRLVVTDEWAIDEYMLQVTFDFRAATVTDAQAAIRTRVANRYELWDSCGDPADLLHYPAG